MNRTARRRAEADARHALARLRQIGASVEYFPECRCWMADTGNPGDRPAILAIVGDKANQDAIRRVLASEHAERN